MTSLQGSTLRHLLTDASLKLLRAITTLLSVLICLSSAGVQADSSTLNDAGSNNAKLPTKYAIVIGVNKYRNYPDLNYSVNDATLLVGSFKRLGYNVRLLQNYDADPDHILDTIYRIGNLLDNGAGRESGTLVVTFSGHGFEQDGMNFIATGKTDPASLRNTSLPLSKLKQVLAKSDIARTMMFIDACRNSPTRSIPGTNDPFVLDSTNEGLGIIYSTAAGELSWEDNKIGHGIFSYYLADALAGAASDNNKQLTFNNVFSHLRSRVANHVFERFEEEQFPYIAGERGGDIIIGQVPPIDTTLPLPPNQMASDQTTTTTVTTDSATISPGADQSVWKKTLLTVGAIALGAILLSSSSSNDNTSTDNVTLVIPTP